MGSKPVTSVAVLAESWEQLHDCLPTRLSLMAPSRPPRPEGTACLLCDKATRLLEQQVRQMPGSCILQPLTASSKYIISTSTRHSVHLSPPRCSGLSLRTLKLLHRGAQSPGQQQGDHHEGYPHQRFCQTLGCCTPAALILSALFLWLLW